MTARCNWPAGCTEPADTRDWCEPHYKKLLYNRLVASTLVDAAPAREWIHRQLERGRTWHSISTRTGIDDCTVADIHTGTTKQVYARTEAAILGLPLRPSTVGCVRRVQALQSLGHPLRTIAAESGLSYGQVKDLASGACGERVFDTTAEGVAAAYDRLVSRVGKPGLAARAERNGRLGPGAWQGVDIDDPAAEPWGAPLVFGPTGRPPDTKPFFSPYYYFAMTGKWPTRSAA